VELMNAIVWELAIIAGTSVVSAGAITGLVIAVARFMAVLASAVEPSPPRWHRALSPEEATRFAVALEDALNRRQA
jgi:hypothetical protein